MGATYPTKILLAFRSGGICAFPSCAKNLSYESALGIDTYIGEAAHIRGEKVKAARYDPLMTDVERDSIENLLYLCTDDHTLIDKVEEDWPTEKLMALKTEHEAKVRIAIEQAFANVEFRELEKAVAWVSSNAPSTEATDFDAISLDQKISKNQLSVGSRHIIAAGLSSRPTVHAYIEAETQLDPDFPGRLTAGFLAQYYNFVQQGHKGDILFELMCAFSQRGLLKQLEKTAGLAVFIYLFEICDVFEK